MEWRWFTVKESKDAQSHLKDGGVLVQQTNCGHGKETGMLYAPSIESLTKAGMELGLNSKWMRKKGCTPHFELKGEPLRRAKRHCTNFEE